MPSQQLDLIPANNATTARAGCSKDLFARLSSAEPTETVVRELARDQVIKADAMAARSALERRQRPCGQEGIALLVMPLTGVFTMPDRSESEWQMFWQVYIDALSGLPFEALEWAAKEHVRESAYFPKPAELYKRAQPIAEKIRIAAWRARKIAEYKAPPVREITDSDRQRVRELLANFRLAPIPKPAVNETPHEMAERLRKLA